MGLTVSLPKTLPSSHKTLIYTQDRQYFRLPCEKLFGHLCWYCVYAMGVEDHEMDVYYD